MAASPFNRAGAAQKLRTLNLGLRVPLKHPERVVGDVVALLEAAEANATRLLGTDSPCALEAKVVGACKSSAEALFFFRSIS